jgi:hypothetical protein
MEPVNHARTKSVDKTLVKRGLPVSANHEICSFSLPMMNGGVEEKYGKGGESVGVSPGIRTGVSAPRERYLSTMASSRREWKFDGA